MRYMKRSRLFIFGILSAFILTSCSLFIPPRRDTSDNSDSSSINSYSDSGESTSNKDVDPKWKIPTSLGNIKVYTPQQFNKLFDDMAVDAISSENIYLQGRIVDISDINLGSLTIEDINGNDTAYIYETVSNDNPFPSLGNKPKNGDVVILYGQYQYQQGIKKAMIDANLLAVNGEIYQNIQPEGNDTFTIDCDSFPYISSQYSSGNYARYDVNGHLFEGRCVYANSDDSHFMRLVHMTYSYTYHEGPSAFYNVNPFDDICKIVITYKSSTSPMFELFDNPDNKEVYLLSSSFKDNEVTIVPINNACYFRILEGGSDTHIKSIVIHYSGTSAKKCQKMNYQDNRYPITGVDKTFSEGETKKVHISSNETKTYTYHTSSYILSNPSLASEYAYIDPVDVANYYIAFHEAPCNYVEKSSLSTYKSIFGDNLRLKQSFSYTSGYVRSFGEYKINNVPGESYPLYYEFDIAITNQYSANGSRSVGRIVVFSNGINCYGDANENIPLICFTDDHYQTFQEYNNMGGFSFRFDAYNSGGYYSSYSMTNYTPLNNISL